MYYQEKLPDQPNKLAVVVVGGGAARVVAAADVEGNAEAEDCKFVVAAVVVGEDESDAEHAVADK